MTQSVLVIGSNGLLGSLVERQLGRAGFLVRSYKGRAELDVADLKAVTSAVKGADFVINCSAYTAVDKAESEPVAAMLGNTLGPKNLATAVQSSGGRLIHVSTDYVYGKVSTTQPILEDTPPAPVGVYGHTKYLGDEFVSLLLPERGAVVRTSWLHGESGPNFVRTIRNLAVDRAELRVVNDQIGSPTYAGFLARALTQFVSRFQPGVFHAANRGAVSWYDFAKRIVELSGFACKILPQSTAESNRPAPRPAWSVLNVSKLEAVLDMPFQSWEDGLVEHLAQLKNQGSL